MEPARLRLAAFVFLTTAAGTFAQNAQITGKVTDPSGSAIPGASIAVTNAQTGIRRGAATSQEGDYNVPLLQPGSYDVVVRKEGFKPVSRREVKLRVDDRVTLDFRLEIGTQLETVVVESDPPLLRIQDAQVGDIISAQMIATVPQINRNPLELLRLSGNISGNGKIPNNSQEVDSDTRINGGRTSGIEFLVDGQTVMTGKSHGVPVSAIPTMESVSEFKVISNGIAAEYGRASGGLVELVTRGGTNQLHGQLFEYFHNQLLNANAWNQNQTAQWRPGKKADRTQFHQNDYGFQLGGPVFIPRTYNGRNRTFFLFNFEGLKYRRAGVLNVGMAPTEAERNGDLTGLLTNGAGVMMWDPLGEIIQTPDGPQKRTPLGGDGKHIPASRISDFARTVLSYVRPQNRPPTPGYTQQNAYMGVTSHQSDQAIWTVRLDQNLGESHHVYLRFNRDTYSDIDTEWRSDLQPDFGNRRPGSLAPTIAWDWTISPTLVLNTRFSMVHHPNLHGPQFKADLSGWNIDPIWKRLANNLPTFNFRVWSANDEGWGSSIGQQFGIFPSMDNFTNGSATASITRIAAKHTFKFGGETRRYYDNHWEDQAGVMNFQGGDLVRNNWGDPGVADFSVLAGSWGQFLLGRMDSGSKISRYTLANAINYYAAYVQDDFKVSRRLTLNLGLRWDMESPLSERHNKIFGYDPDAPSAYSMNPGWSWNDQLSKAGLTSQQIASLPVPSWVRDGKFPNGALQFAATPEHPGRLMQRYHPLQFAPRFGAAFQLTPNTVLRGSWGTMYLTKTGNYWESWVTASDSANIPWLDRDARGNTGHPVEDSFFHPGQLQIYERTSAQLNFTQNSGVSTDKHAPFEQNWSFGIQRQLPWSIVADATYNGNHSGDLLTPWPLSPYPGNLISPANSKLFKTPIENPVKGQIRGSNSYSYDQVPLGILFLSNPVFGGVTPDGYNRGRTNYNALNLRLEKRLSHGVALLVNYTYSKSLDNVGGVAGPGNGTAAFKGLQSSWTYDDVYGYSPLDETHRFAFFHDAQFPVGRGRRILGSPTGWSAKMLERFVGGWEYAGTCLFRSGRPLKFQPMTTGVSTDSGIPALWGSILGDWNAITPAGFRDPSQVLAGINADPNAMPVRRFDPARFTLAQDMVAGNVPPIFPWIRNPGSLSYDGSLMKSFPLSGEGRFLQFRMEAENLFNQRGLGPYNTSVGDPYFGLITKAGQTPRTIQVSARLVF